MPDPMIRPCPACGADLSDSTIGAMRSGEVLRCPFCHYELATFDQVVALVYGRGPRVIDA